MPITCLTMKYKLPPELLKFPSTILFAIEAFDNAAIPVEKGLATSKKGIKDFVANSGYHANKKITLIGGYDRSITRRIN